jgi:hypothetical protein
VDEEADRKGAGKGSTEERKILFDCAVLYTFTTSRKRFARPKAET